MTKLYGKASRDQIEKLKQSGWKVQEELDGVVIEVETPLLDVLAFLEPPPPAPPEILNRENGNFLTYLDPLTKKETYVGYLMVADHGVYDATLGKIPVDPIVAAAHNKLLSQVEIRGLDEQCEVGQGNSFFFNSRTGRVVTWTGELVSDQVEVRRKRPTSFKRGAREFKVTRYDPDGNSLFAKRTR